MEPTRLIVCDLNALVLKRSQKVRDRFLAHPDKSGTLEELVLNEKGEKKRTATEGLMWLLRSGRSPHSFPSTSKKKCTQLTATALACAFLPRFCRGLDFTAQALRRNVDNKDEELSVSFREAYANTLKKFHGFLIRPIFSVSEAKTPIMPSFVASPSALY